MTSVFVALDQEQDHQEAIDYLRSRADVKLAIFEWADFQYFWSVPCQRTNSAYKRMNRAQGPRVIDSASSDLVQIEKPSVVLEKLVREGDAPDILLLDPDMYLIKPHFMERKGDESCSVFNPETGQFEAMGPIPVDEFLDKKNRIGVGMAYGFVGLGVRTIILYDEDTKSVYDHFSDNPIVTGISKPYPQGELIRALEKNL